MKKGLILEGGAMRGMFSCGVLDVFMENGITFDGAAGISAGAVFGCNFKSRQIGRGIRYNIKYGKDPRYCSLRSLVKTGDLYGAEFCYHEIPDKLDVFDRKAFAENPMEFYIGATDVRTGREVYYQCTDGGQRDMEWMRASASMPLVSRVVNVDGYSLLDGGIVEAVPYRCMKERGYDRNVVVLTQPAEYRKEKASALPLFRIVLRKYPKVWEAMKVRHERYNAQIRELESLERAGELMIIRPSESLGIGRTESDPAELERVYRTGRKMAASRIQAVRDFLSA